MASLTGSAAAASYPIDNFCLCGSLRGGAIFTSIITLAAGVVAILATLQLNESYGYILGTEYN